MQVILTDDDGREYDITEHFRVMYDNVVQSMDWGSGFLDGGEALTVMQAGAAAGFELVIGDSTLENLVNTFDIRAQVDKANPIPQFGGDAYANSKAYCALKKERKAWIAEKLGDPPSWDSIERYRQYLTERENSE